jgi:hypothetical protein
MTLVILLYPSMARIESPRHEYPPDIESTEIPEIPSTINTE